MYLVWLCLQIAVKVSAPTSPYNTSAAADISSFLLLKDIRTEADKNACLILFTGSKYYNDEIQVTPFLHSVLR